MTAVSDARSRHAFPPGGIHLNSDEASLKNRIGIDKQKVVRKKVSYPTAKSVTQEKGPRLGFVFAKEMLDDVRPRPLFVIKFRRVPDDLGVDQIDDILGDVGRMVGDTFQMPPN